MRDTEVPHYVVQHTPPSRTAKLVHLIRLGLGLVLVVQNATPRCTTLRFDSRLPQHVYASGQHQALAAPDTPDVCVCVCMRVCVRVYMGRVRVSAVEEDEDEERLTVEKGHGTCDEGSHASALTVSRAVPINRRHLFTH